MQSESAILGIQMMFSVFPALLGVLVAVCICFYRIDDARLRQMELELAAQR